MIVLALSTHTHISHSREESESVVPDISLERRRPAPRSRTVLPGHATLWVKPVSHGPKSWAKRESAENK